MSFNGGEYRINKLVDPETGRCLELPKRKYSEVIKQQHKERQRLLWIYENSDSNNNESLNSEINISTCEEINRILEKQQFIKQSGSIYGNVGDAVRGRSVKLTQQQQFTTYDQLYQFPKLPANNIQGMQQNSTPKLNEGHDRQSLVGAAQPAQHLQMASASTNSYYSHFPLLSRNDDNRLKQYHQLPVRCAPITSTSSKAEARVGGNLSQDSSSSKYSDLPQNSSSSRCVPSYKNYQLTNQSRINKVPPNSPVDGIVAVNNKNFHQDVTRRLYETKLGARDANITDDAPIRLLRNSRETFAIPQDVSPRMRLLRPENISLPFNKILYNIFRAKKGILKPTWEFALLMRSALIRKLHRYYTHNIVHVHGCFFSDPAHRYGLCLFCINYTPTNWELVKIHVVAHISTVESVKCANCGRGICKFAQASDCIDCLFTYFPNKEEIDNGQVYQSL